MPPNTSPMGRGSHARAVVPPSVIAIVCTPPAVQHMVRVPPLLMIRWVSEHSHALAVALLPPPLVVGCAEYRLLLGEWSELWLVFERELVRMPLRTIGKGRRHSPA